MKRGRPRNAESRRQQSPSPRLDAVLRELIDEALGNCPFCGSGAGRVRVHGHEQCRFCTAVIVRCCDD